MNGLTSKVVQKVEPGQQERVYNQAAEKISTGKLADAAAVLTAMATIYPSDDAFRANFS